MAHNSSWRERFNISRVAIQYPWLTLGFWLAVCVAGAVSFRTLKYNLFPDITFPVVVVNAQAPLTTALATEQALTRPLEARLQTLLGVAKVRSATYPGQTTVSLAFDVGTNLEASRDLVQATVQALNLAPKPTFQVIPLNLNESAAVSYALSSPKQNLSELAKLARSELIPSIAKLPGVLKVNLLGATNTAVRFNGQEALAFQVVKRGDANTLEVVSQVEKEVAQLHAQFPEVRLELAATQATYIREATSATIEALILAVVLSILVIYPFLGNWQATLISALAIPISLLGTFIVMAAYGFNLETITLLALALVIGIIVDDAIVDVENIARHLEEGELPLQAALNATNEIGLTVTATTLTIVAVFLPVGLMGGVLGQFFQPFGLTISAAVITSLLVARTLSPLLAVYWLKPAPTRQDSDAWTRFVTRYRELLAWALAHPGTVLGLALLSFGGGLGLIPFISKGFIPHLDRGEFNLVYQAPPMISLAQSGVLARELETVVRRAPDVEAVFTTVGSRQGQPNRGLLYIKMRPERKLTTSAQQNELRDQLPTFPGVTTSVEDIQFVDNGGEKPLQFALLAEDLKALEQAGSDLKAQVQKLPGFVDVTSSGGQGGIEHLNGKRVSYISANLGSGLTLGAATDQVVAKAKTTLPATVKLDLGGDSERAADTFGGFGATLALSVLCVLGVLLLLFRSWVDPMVIILSLPLSIVGAMLAQFVTRSDFGIISIIGLIFLLGLVNKNAILLVDYINQLRARGLSRSEAILRAGPVRLRPILMTTAATVLGMLPIALGLGAGAELRAPMAIVIIGGLLASTLLSLLVIPVAYTFFDKIRANFAKRGH